MKTTKTKTFIDIQLFAEPIAEPQVEPIAEPPIILEPVKTYTEAEYKALKIAFDKTASELATEKKTKKQIEDASKSKEQLELEEKEALKLELAQLKKGRCGDKATALTAEAKTKVSLDPKDTTFDEVVSTIIGENEEITAKQATALNKLLLAIYEKGKLDSTKSNVGDMSKGILQGGSTENKSSYATRAAEFSKNVNTANIKDNYK